MLAGVVAVWRAEGARAATAPSSNGGSRIVGVPSGKCIDVTGGSDTDGTRVQLYSCIGDPQQAWVWSSGRLEVYSGSHTLCLDANDNYHGANGTPIQVWKCTGAPNQAWTAEANGTLKSNAYGLCLDAINDSQTNGTKLQLWTCNGNPQQDWTGQPEPNGGGLVKNAGSGSCLDVTAASISPSARPQIYGCLDDAQQQWQYSGHELEVYADKCLDARNDGKTPGTPVQIWYCNGDPQQQWSWDGDGEIKGLASGLCLEPVNQDTTNGTQLVLWTCTGSAGQSWSRGTSSAPSPPVSTTPVPTPIPTPKHHKRHALEVHLLLSWTWRGATTWLHQIKIGRFPARTTMTIRCSGRGCGRDSRVRARGKRRIDRMLRKLKGHAYRRGDVIRITLGAPGYLSERAELVIRNGRRPRVRT